jgi:hypothetical protein
MYVNRGIIVALGSLALIGMSFGMLSIVMSSLIYEEGPSPAGRHLTDTDGNTNIKVSNILFSWWRFLYCQHGLF